MTYFTVMFIKKENPSKIKTSGQEKVSCITSEVFPFGCKADTEYSFQYSGSTSMPGKQEMQGSIPFVPFCCHSMTLLLSYKKLFQKGI